MSEILDSDSSRKATVSSRGNNFDNSVGECVPEALRTYDGVNLENNAEFEEKIFPLFRLHMSVIDFWLTTLILPVQAKQFPKKVVATPWDLCSSTAITTGFSGTDDLSLVLPLTIASKKLKSLETTNGEQLK